ncbi:hypothetical protein E4U41_005121 [Claviceps citrina]|nr:hypothetical protein E4U41_005121 [Claviceps citrina]
MSPQHADARRRTPVDTQRVILRNSSRDCLLQDDWSAEEMGSTLEHAAAEEGLLDVNEDTAPRRRRTRRHGHQVRIHVFTLSRTITMTSSK